MQAHKEERSSRRWNYLLHVAVVIGGLVATVSGSVASQNAGVSWPAYLAGFAGAVVTACGAAAFKLRPVEKLRFARSQRARFERVALKAENGVALGSGAELVNELTDELTEIRLRELPD